MNTSTAKQSRSRSSGTVKIALMALMAFFVAESLAIAQDFEFTLRQRRANDWITVEVWAKAQANDTTKLGDASLVIDYNSSFLQPVTTTAGVNLNLTDSINFDVDQADPVDNITSSFHSGNGYNALGNQAYESGSDKYNALEIRLAALSSNGLTPATTGNGSFLGKIYFEITNYATLTDSTLTNIVWNSNTSVGDVRVFDRNGNDIEAQCTFTDPSDFAIRGITILNPDGEGEVVNRDKEYASFPVTTANGYPIYFERSGFNLDLARITNATAYVFQYSLNSGSSWTEFGRIAESELVTTAGLTTAYLNRHISGNLATIASVSTTAIITTHTGASLSVGNSTFRDPLRVIWSSDATFSSRSEQARLRICQLTTTATADIDSRTALTVCDDSDADFVIGRLFFYQLDGATTYGKTSGNYSNATQLTAEAWVNLNADNGDGSEPAIIASSGGPNAGEEGQWMLYLKDGNIPAFRAREIEGRGTNGYVADVSSSLDALTAVSDAIPLGSAHTNNWTHIAATVSNATITLYVNGELVAQETNDSANDIRMGVANQQTNHPLWVGVNPNVSIDASDYLQAGLKGVRVWRTALTQTQIRQRVSGISNPSVTSATFNIHRTLEFYWDLDENLRSDRASETIFQNGVDNLQHYVSGTIDNSAANFRPDRPHLRLTSPVGCEGITNTSTATFTVRWVGYGVGTTGNVQADGTVVTNTLDIDLRYTANDGTSFEFARNNAGTDIGSSTAVDIEAGQVVWRPSRNNGPTTAFDLSTNSGTFSKTVKLQLRGSASGDQAVEFNTDEFVVAPFHSLNRDEDVIIGVEDETGARALSFSGTVAFFEAWIRPHRFPTANEGYFPIMFKGDSANGQIDYAMRLLNTGQIQFVMTDSDNVERTATSDIDDILLEPLITENDTAWTHVGVYVNLGDGTGSSDIRFYIDGSPQSSDTAITNQLGDALTIDGLNSNPFYIGYEPYFSTTATAKGFIGELREVRMWNGTPGNRSVAGNEPTELTLQIQGAQAVTGANLVSTTNGNLVASFGLQGGGFVNDGYARSLASNNPNVRALVRGGNVCYVGEEPYIKLVEPSYKQSVRNSTTDLRVRWVGFNYVPVNFSRGFGGSTTGTLGAIAPSLEYSLRGGGGLVIQPYQFVSGQYYHATQATTFNPQNSTSYRFFGDGQATQFAATFNVNLGDPDPDDNEVYTDEQSEISAALTNARLRLTSTSNTIVGTITSEGPLFTITPPSNFTVRAALEGYHTGTSNTLVNIGSTYDAGGIRIKLYEDNAGDPGEFIDSADSQFQYASAAARDGANRGASNSTFANIPFVFTDLEDDDYFVVVDHINHLPVMSRFATPFLFSGDDEDTWAIESGWDFQSWNGAQGNVLPLVTTSPYTPSTEFGYFTAYGNAVNQTTNSISPTAGYSNTGLIRNTGQSTSGTSTAFDPFAIPSLVAGDVVKDAQINAADRVQVRQDFGTTLVRSDVTGDGNVNATDRTIVDRNFGKVSSILDVTFQDAAAMQGGGAEGLATQVDPFSVIAEADPELSRQFNEAAVVARGDKGDNFNEFVPNKVKDVVAGGGISYVASADPVRQDDYILMPFYIRNTGNAWAMGNLTFAVRFPTAVLEFVGLEDIDGVPFNNKPGLGYALMKSGPLNGANKALTDVRTIEIDYDAYSKRSGAVVPNSKTHVGTLRFRFRTPDNLNQPVSFFWYESTAVHAANGQLLTNGGHFEPIKAVLPYTTQVQIPNGGENWRAGRTYDIRWRNEGGSSDRFVRLEYSVDLGQSWQSVSTQPVNASARRFEWRVPGDIASDECLVRVVDAQTGLAIELDQSDQAFEIAPVGGAILQPKSSDPAYVGGKPSLIKWTADGLNEVRFEFSADGGTTWVQIPGNRDAESGQVTWIVPRDVNTKKAKVRMIDVQEGEIIAQTDNFKVVTGALSFITPKLNETMLTDELSRIRWSIEGSIAEFDMDISLDGGQTWQPLASEVVGEDRIFNFTPVVEQVTDNAMLVAYVPGDRELEFGYSNKFKIDFVKDVAEDLGFEFSEPYPNPASNAAQVTFTLPTSSEVTMTLFNTLGEEVAVLVDAQQYTPGTYSMRVDTRDLQPGVYYVQLQPGDVKMIRKLVVVK